MNIEDTCSSRTTMKWGMGLKDDIRQKMYQKE